MSSAPFDPVSLRASLAPFSLVRPGEVTAQQRAYLEHYGIDFANEMAGIEHCFGRLDGGGQALAVHCWRPRNAAGSAIVLHGYFDHVGLYRHLIRFLLERRLAVVGFDLPGHGLSSGEALHIDSFDDYVAAFERCRDAVTGALPRPCHLIGQSTGAAIVMEWVLTNRFTRCTAPFGALVLLAPLVRPAHWSRLRLLYHLARFFIKEQDRGFGRSATDPEFLEFLRARDPLQVRTMPVAWVTALVAWMRRFRRHAATDLDPLVVQGEADTTVDWRYNMQAIAALFDPRTVYLPRARHHLVNEAPEIRECVFAAIAEHLAAHGGDRGTVASGVGAHGAAVMPSGGETDRGREP